MAQLNTYFVFSDVHGEYDALLKSLQDAGYNSNDPTHVLVSLGDNFDRGPNSKKVWNLLYSKAYSTNKPICVKGNHDVMFQEFLEKGMDGEFVLFNILHNGLGKTIQSFSAIDTSTFKIADLNKAKTIINRDPVLKWLQSLPLYYETQHFIFCHAGINPMIGDWRATDEHYMLWDIKDSHLPCENTNKNVIIGHHHAFRVRENAIKAGYGDVDIQTCRYTVGDKSYKYKYFGNQDEHRPFICENKIAIDGCTNYTGKVNVLVIQDYPLEDPKNKTDEEKTTVINNDGISITAT